MPDEDSKKEGGWFGLFGKRQEDKDGGKVDAAPSPAAAPPPAAAVETTQQLI